MSILLFRSVFLPCVVYFAAADEPRGNTHVVKKALSCSVPTCNTEFLLRSFAQKLQYMTDKFSPQGSVFAYTSKIEDAVCSCTIGSIELVEKTTSITKDDTTAAEESREALYGVVSGVFEAVTKAAASFVGFDGEVRTGDIWLSRSEEGFPEVFEMTGSARLQYTQLASELGQLIIGDEASRFSQSDILGLSKTLNSMLALVVNRRETLSKTIAPYIKPTETSALETFMSKKSRQEILVMMVDASQVFLNALFAYGRGWSLGSQHLASIKGEQIDLEEEEEEEEEEKKKKEEDIYFGVAKEIFVEKKKYFFNPPKTAQTYWDDLSVLYRWLREGFFRTMANPCKESRKGAFLKQVLPDSLCTPSQARLDEATYQFAKFEQKLTILEKSDSKIGVLTSISQESFTYFSGLLSNLKATLTNWVIYWKDKEENNWMKVRSKRNKLSKILREEGARRERLAPKSYLYNLASSVASKAKQAISDTLHFVEDYRD